MTTLIRLEGTVVAIAGPTRFYLAPDLAFTGRDEPTRRVVTLMCLYARRLEIAGRGSEYTDQEAEACARLVLRAAHADEPA